MLSISDSNLCIIVFRCPYGYVYDTSTTGDSVVREWDLVCEDEGWHATIGAAQMVGYLFGGLILGGLSDKIGRKPTFIISNSFLLVAGVAAAMAPEYYRCKWLKFICLSKAVLTYHMFNSSSFTAARSVIGFAIAGIESACFVLVMELVGPSKRTVAGIVCWFFETGGLICALVLAFFFNDDWRLLQMAYSLPPALFLAYGWWAPESIRLNIQLNELCSYILMFLMFRWLISQGREKEARRQIERCAEVNGAMLPPALLEVMEATVAKELAEENAQKSYSVIDLFRFFHLRTKTAILTCAWIVCASLYYVLLLDQSELSDNPYIGFLITTSVQVTF
jgi:MFS family permease